MGGGGGGGGGGLGGALGGSAAGGLVMGPAGSVLGAAGGYKGGGGMLGPLGKALGGGGQDAGILGTGQFKGERQDIDEKAFRDQQALAQRQQALQAGLAGVQNRQGPQINMGPQDQFRAAQTGLLGQLQAQAAGQGPSLAQMQLKQAGDRNLANAMAMAATQGQGGGLALRQLQQQRADLGAQQGQQAAQLRLQEQQQAQQGLAGLAGSARGQDIGLASNQAQLALQQGAQNDAMSQFYNQQLGGIAGAQSNALMDLEKLKVNQNLGIQGLNAQGYEGAATRRGNILGGLGEGLASISDKRAKKKIHHGEKDLDKFLSGVHMYSGGLFDEEPNMSSMHQEIASKEPKKFDVGPMSDDEDDSTADIVKSILSKKDDNKETGHHKMGKSLGIGIGGLAMNKGGCVYNMEDGGTVPGKAKVHGDSLKNDTVPAMLSPGEGVIPRTAMHDPEKLQEFVDGLKAYSYEYKKKEHGEGKHISPMAQDLEKTEIGKGMVMDGPDGTKGVNYAKAGGVMLATAAMLNDKMKKIESKLGMSDGGIVEEAKQAAKDVFDFDIDKETEKHQPHEDESFFDMFKKKEKKKEYMAEGGIVGDDKSKKLADSMKLAFKTPGMEEEKPEEKDMNPVTAGFKKAFGMKGYADGGMVEDDNPVSKSMKLAFNFFPKKPEPQHRPDYSTPVTEEEKKFAEAMRKAFRGK